jgi:hypothetical protein
MRVRDLLILAAVLLVGGFAAADALRGDAERDAPPTTAVGRSTRPPATSETGPIETVEGARAAVLAGRLVYTNGGCALLEVDLGSGAVLPLRTAPNTCDLISAPRSLALAFSLPSRRRDVMPYRVIDLKRPELDLASFHARAGSVVWSPDGKRVGWCEPSGRGQEVELGREPRPLRRCPIGYTPNGAPLHTRGKFLLAGRRTLVETSSRVEAVSFAADGSLGVLTALGRVVLYRHGEDGELRPEYVLSLPPELRGLPILFSPTHCQAALSSSVFPPTPTVFVRDLRPCPGSRAPVTFAGRAAAWSPDGTRLAIAERERVVIHPTLGDEPAVVLPLVASDLAWKD